MFVRAFRSFLFVSEFALAASGQQSTCGEVQKKLDRVLASGHQVVSDTDVSDLGRVFGKPLRMRQLTTGTTLLLYSFSGCSVEFYIGDRGKVLSKKFQYVRSNSATTADRPRITSNLEWEVLMLQGAVRQLQQKVAELESQLRSQQHPAVSDVKPLELPPAPELEPIQGSPKNGPDPAVTAIRQLIPPPKKHDL